MNEDKNRLVVIGERFAHFGAIHQGVTTVGEVSTALSAIEAHGEPTLLTFGQGVDSFAVGYVKEEVNRRGLANQIAVRDAGVGVATRHDVHKWRSTNVLLGPIERFEKEFGAPLNLHGDNELLLDHQTGLHVQGMVTVEACRQMALAICDSVSRTDLTTGVRYATTLDRMDMNFQNFLFPVPAGVSARLVQLDDTDPRWCKLRVEVEVRQGQRMALAATIDCSLIDQEIIARIEHKRALEALESVGLMTTSREMAGAV